MKHRIYQIDAFTDRVFSGNPAAVCPLDEWLSDDLLQKIAMENNLAETAFYVRDGNEYHIRWFTPKTEVDLCGHATLAAAFVLFHCENYTEETIRFFSPRSGKLTVSRQDDLLTLNFPIDCFEQTELTDDLRQCFHISPKQAFRGKTDYLLVFDTEEQILRIKPDLGQIAKLDVRGVIITAKGDNVDFVSRFFAPQCGIDEDPVTGSAHTTLTPYWSERLNKTELTAIQLSERKGYLHCRLSGDRVEISGNARLYLIGEIFIE
ncbi:MAG: PhzF family phenazine biosynthesis protein [Bacteroidota bacterium]|nr:PhzF family phenazine biosynthesis protein [Bacteroidota bacterium]